ncbi:hypothetical protein CQW31_01555 [Pseudomonas sp. 382]|nr:hypothetical protein DZC31_15755 [Stenotrophomonas rhizophila]PIK80389.1 hypothetical protein CQW31_01555 [Pseudomonas sp. 382]
MGAGVPAKQAMRWMAPALPVFAGTPAPTEIAQVFIKDRPMPGSSAHALSALPAAAANLAS